MLSVNPILEQVCVVGTGLRQPIALVVPSEIGKNMPRERLMESLEETLKRVNPNFKNYEALKKAVVVKDLWTAENNMLTPTLKIKRNVVENYYKAKLEAWDELEENVIFE